VTRVTKRLEFTAGEREIVPNCRVTTRAGDPNGRGRIAPTGTSFVDRRQRYDIRFSASAILMSFSRRTKNIGA
jgi:hypothetical protein